MKSRIYLDNNATTPIDAELFSSYVEALRNDFGNPSSIHQEGQKARSLLLEARTELARCLQVSPQEIFFTSSATEGLNLILRGFFGYHPKGHVITSDLEHSAVFRTLQDLESKGLSVSYLPGGAFGAVTPEQVEAAIRHGTSLISIMAVNNETGVMTDIEAISQVAEKYNIPFVVDGVALFGKEPFSIPKAVSAMVFSGHKFHAPKGTGFAVIRKKLKLQPLITGGEQEYGKRGGTENVPACMILAKAALKAMQLVHEASQQMRALRNLFEEKLKAILPQIRINGLGPRVSNTSNICFPGIDGEALLVYLDLHGVSASMGSACASGALEPSRVLVHMGLARKEAMSSLRFSLSRYTTQEEIERAVELVASGIALQSK